jgi:2',3'-cyclic-nucleotide 2'-phosphodiesterase (5'-nucleotidase family)
MKAVVDEFRKTDPEGVLLLDGGDTIQGSAWAVKSKGADLVPVLNLMGIDLAIPGNWEVVYGTATFQEIAKKLKYRFIAANVFDEKSGELVFPLT